jgi:hypothetical protein
MKRAVEETFNDSELVKGVGKVIKNQYIVKSTEPTEEKPFDLSPTEFGWQDASFPLQQFITTGQRIKQGMCISFYV